MRRIGSEAYLFALSAIALLGLLALELTGHPADDTMKAVALLAGGAGAGASTPSIVRHMVSAAASVAETVAEPAPEPAPVAPAPAVPPFVDQP